MGLKGAQASNHFQTLTCGTASTCLLHTHSSQCGWPCSLGNSIKKKDTTLITVKGGKSNGKLLPGETNVNIMSDIRMRVLGCHAAFTFKNLTHAAEKAWNHWRMRFLRSFRCLVARRKVSEQRWAVTADSAIALTRDCVMSDAFVQCIKHFQQKVRFNTNHPLLLLLVDNLFVSVCNPQISPAFSWQPVHPTITMQFRQYRWFLNQLKGV
jgi:hypothetical protein